MFQFIPVFVLFTYYYEFFSSLYPVIVIKSLKIKVGSVNNCVNGV